MRGQLSRLSANVHVNDLTHYLTHHLTHCLTHCLYAGRDRGCTREGRWRQRRKKKGELTEGTKSVVEGDDDDVAEGSQDISVQHPPHALLVGAAVHVHQHRKSTFSGHLPSKYDVMPTARVKGRRSSQRQRISKDSFFWGGRGLSHFPTSPPTPPFIPLPIPNCFQVFNTNCQQLVLIFFFFFTLVRSKKMCEEHVITFSLDF